MITKVTHDAVGREIGQAELLGETDQERADGRARDRAHAADDHHHQRGEQVAHVLARRDGERRAADHAGETREPGADGEDQREDQLDVEAGGVEHLAVVDPGADGHVRAACG